MAQMRADTRLKDTQAATEWPKLYVSLIVAVAAIFGSLFGIAGFIVGRGLGR